MNMIYVAILFLINLLGETNTTVMEESQDSCSDQQVVKEKEQSEEAESTNIGKEKIDSESKNEKQNAESTNIEKEKIDSESENEKQTVESTESKGLCTSGDEQFPTTLDGFGYTFKDGRMVSISNGGPFVFEVRKGDKKYNQKHYEALGEVITELVYELLIKDTKLHKHIIPVDKKDNEPSSFFFATEDAFINPDKLMLLIHGSGVVRAGQWARRLIINDCLDSGTQLPFIKRAVNEGYGVVVLNTNMNYVQIDGKKTLIRESSTPEEHGRYVWQHFISKAPAKRIDIVAHSYGGVVTVEMIKSFLEDFQKRVHKIAFTDSVHNLGLQNISQVARRYITLSTVNWVSCDEPLDKPQPSSRNAVRRLSAGTTKHEETSWYAFESIFKYFIES